MDISKQQKYDHLYIDIASLTAKMSYAILSKVGCVIVKDDRILSYGWNGSVKGFDNHCEDEEELFVIKDDKWQISSFGFVKNLKKNFILKPQKTSTGYLHLKLDQDRTSVHKLVANSFIINPNPSFYTQINHIDGNKTNNNVLNLEFCTARYNSLERDKNSNLRIKSSKYPGVYKLKNKNLWCAVAEINGQRHVKTSRDEYEMYVFWKSFIPEEELKTIKFDIRKVLKTKPATLHAELNALTKLLKHGDSSRDSILYTTMSPCLECSKLIIQSGIKRVVYLEEYRDASGIELLKKTDIIVEKFNLT